MYESVYFLHFSKWAWQKHTYRRMKQRVVAVCRKSVWKTKFTAQRLKIKLFKNDENLYCDVLVLRIIYNRSKFQINISRSLLWIMLENVWRRLLNSFRLGGIVSLFYYKITTGTVPVLHNNNSKAGHLNFAHRLSYAFIGTTLTTSTTGYELKRARNIYLYS